MDTAHLYVGIHKQQIYVQQSQRMADLVHQSMLEMQNESNQKWALPGLVREPYFL